MLNKRYIKSIKRDIFCFDFLSSILVSISFLLYIGKEREVVSLCKMTGKNIEITPDGTHREIKIESTLIQQIQRKNVESTLIQC